MACRLPAIFTPAGSSPMFMYGWYPLTRKDFLCSSSAQKKYDHRLFPPMKSWLITKELNKKPSWLDSFFTISDAAAEMLLENFMRIPLCHLHFIFQQKFCFFMTTLMGSPSFFNGKRERVERAALSCCKKHSFMYYRKRLVGDFKTGKV